MIECKIALLLSHAAFFHRWSGEIGNGMKIIFDYTLEMRKDRQMAFIKKNGGRNKAGDYEKW